MTSPLRNILSVTTLLLWLLTPVLTMAASWQISGSNTLGARLVPALIESWLQQQGIAFERSTVAENEVAYQLVPALSGLDSIRVHAHGSSTAFADLASGVAQIGMSSRRIRDAEVDMLAALAPMQDPHHEIVIGLDGVAVIVPPDNTLQTLSMAQLRRAFAGSLRDWRELTRERSGAIRLYARDSKSGTFGVFDDLVMGGLDIAATAQRFESNELLAESVSSDASALGFTSVAAVEDVRAVTISASANRPIAPQPLMLMTEDYPLSRRLYLYVPQPDDALLQRWLEYVLSPAGQQVVSASGFTNLELFAVAAELPAQAPDSYRKLLTGARRLAVNFRFDEKQVRLDSKARRDVARVADYVRQHADALTDLLVLGFSDALEVAEVHSIMLSNDRADAVAAELLRAGIPATSVRGFGSAIPVADAADSNRNRRVEIWVRSDPNATRRPYRSLSRTSVAKSN
ncbi:MAG: substrate-binding domain-containing protein [Wenzhouxiangellaceae bacterium]